MVDLERREVVDVLHDRSAKTTAAWLAEHPTVEIVSRDRCGLYAQAARQGAAKARQVADRFHLIQNLRRAIEQQPSRDHCPSKTMRSEAIPQPTAATLDHDEVLEHRQTVRHGRHDGWLDRFSQVKALQRAGQSLDTIVEQTGLNWRTVAKWVASDVLPERRLMDPRSTNPVKFEDFLAQRWDEGFRNGRRLLTEVRQQGYTGSFSHLERLLSNWRRAGRAVLVQKASRIAPSSHVAADILSSTEFATDPGILHHRLTRNLQDGDTNGAIRAAGKLRTTRENSFPSRVK